MNDVVIKKVRNKKPLIHHITNQVVMNFSANGLLAFGGSPIMAHAASEATDVTKLSDGLVMNIGTLTEDQLEPMILSGQAANDLGIPVVLDPVGVGATAFRSEAFKKITERVEATVIKGNAGEVAHLIGADLEMKGVDFVGDAYASDISRRVALHYNTIVLCTGEVDVVTDGKRELMNSRGHEILTSITGAGCLLGSVVSACMSVEGDRLDNVLTAASYYGAAAERAADHHTVGGPGTFLPQFIDQLAAGGGE
ncbi:hydroxyethylthiazole kinase [Halobacillus litoralis]|uniref:hydroxyethylthiazole kinase n=1 Tax=Halobacillus litoralis TaxID=45668 RepID=UPI001CD64D92|nr:hydroxyethylthiazole kinase [Halobacillus litoralis]MCA0969431.1 hydroxyethylthiazole kinase [Halobacillus litoralis]